MREMREKRERMRMTREERTNNMVEKMTGTRLRVMRELLREVVREAQGMVIPFLSSFPRFRPSTISSRR